MADVGSRFREAEKQLSRKAVRLELLKEQEDKLSQEIESLSSTHLDYQEASVLLVKIAQAHRRLSLERVESLVTTALRAVFEHPYKFRFKQEEKRGQIELVPVVIDDELELDPVTSMGGGIVDVISITLRIVLWSLMKDRTDPIIIQDEPARQVNSETYVRNLARMMKDLSETLGLQFINVTNRDAFTHASDKVFRVYKPGKVSKVDVVGGQSEHT